MALTDTQSLQALAYLFVTFGHSTDGTLGMDEMRSLAGRLAQRAGGTDLAQIGELLKAAVTEYRGLGSMDDKMARAQQHIETLRAQAETGEVQGVLEDLQEIAGADGSISPEEEKFIADVARALSGG